MNKNISEEYKVFFNGKIYTSNKNQENVTAFVCKNDKFIYVGSDEKALKFKTHNTFDLKGKRVLPGFMDTHCHYVMMSLKSLEDSIEIEQNMSHLKVLEMIKEIVSKKSVDDLPIVFGLGYGTDCIPLASELDKAVNDRPVFLYDSGGHSGWMNTKLMELINLTKDTPDPKPGVCYFKRDENGNPTGQAVENDAMVYVERQLGASSPELLEKQLPEINRIANSFGYTSVFDAGFIFSGEKRILETLNSMNLTLRYFTSFYYDGLSDKEGFIKEMIECRKLYTSELLRPTTLKMFKDGTIEAFSAFMFDEYEKPGHGKGAKTLKHDQLLEMGKISCAENFNIHIHAIGDAAIEDVLNIYDELGDIAGTKTIAHVQVLPENGLKRFEKQNEIIYQTTPVWLGFDQFTKDVLGPERYIRQMPLKTLKNNGTTLTFGSDAPVSGGLIGLNPFINICCAVNRYDQTRFIPPSNEAITVEDCIDAYTINGAKQVNSENEFGTIEKGKSADFIILNQDILAIDTNKIQNTKVLETWFKGNCIFKV
ncbi:amidohydrolase [Methanobrevibacter sp. DSM 116169]|uniref:amidohydrolase n=1 Tax=Methanobrevibacter sp. DSM 116169 TaxID=3242727 RepID=UPI0038FC03E6